MTSRAARNACPRQAAALEERGATVVTSETSEIEPSLRALVSRGVHSVIVEGGSQLHAAVWRDRLVDYVQVYVAPVSMPGGSGRLPEASTFSLASLLDPVVTPMGPDVLIEGYVHRPH
jgi:riboflavin biosynthesis pyrimidine reductase